MAQNIYDNKKFFEGYSQLNRSVHGLNGAPEWPSVVKMLPDLKGKVVADLGCGYGWFCRYATERGAQHVLGVDISEKMLEKARELTQDDTITYWKGDLESLNLEKNKYDLVYSSLTLHYIENLSQLIGKVYQSLKPNGLFVFSAEHPIYTAPEHPGWLIDKETGKKSWPVSGYQDEGKRVTDWMVEGVVKQHRLLSTYLNILIDNGFVIKHVNEFGPSLQQIKDSPWLEEERERPMFFLTSAMKTVL